MQYRAPLTLTDKLADLKGNYEKATGTSLTAGSPWAVTTFFGATDVDSRRQQIDIIERFVALTEEAIKSGDKVLINNAYCRLVAVCHLVRSNIEKTYKIPRPNYGTLHTLIGEALEIDAKNVLDPASLVQSLETLRSSDLEKLNQQLSTLGKPPITSIDWLNIDARTSRLSHKAQNPKTLSASSSLAWAGGKIGRIAGVGIGWAIGKTVGRSGLTAPLKGFVTGGICYMFRLSGYIAGTSAIAATVLARPHAEAAVESACGVGTAMALAGAGGLFGHAAGKTAGIPIDYAISGIKVVTIKIHDLFEDKDGHYKTGLDLLSGDVMVVDAKGKRVNIEDFISRRVVEAASGTKELGEMEAMPLSDEEIQRMEKFLEMQPTVTEAELINSEPTSPVSPSTASKPATTEALIPSSPSSL